MLLATALRSSGVVKDSHRTDQAISKKSVSAADNLHL